MQTHYKTTYKTTLEAPIQKVWDALVKPELVKQYFFGSNLVTDWKVGSPIYFEGDWEGKPYQDKGIVLQFIPLQKVEFTYLSSWSGLPDLPENYLLVSYELKALPQGTELCITQSNYDAEKAKHSEDNWAQVIDEMKKILFK